MCAAEKFQGVHGKKKHISDEVQEEVAPGENKREGERPALSDPLSIYLREIKQHPLLGREEETELAIRYRETGDLEPACKLICANLRLVVKIAMDFQLYWIQNLTDLIQEGNLGLMQAVKKFDPYRGYKFSYYASFWIKAYIIKFIMDNWKLVKIGTTQAQRKLFFNLRKEEERLETRGITASPKLLSRRLNVKESEVVEMDQRLNSWEVSLDGPLGEDSADAHKSFLPSEEPPVDERLADQEAESIFHDKLELFRRRLRGKDAVIFDRRLLTEKPATLQEMGEKFGMSRQRVRRLESSLIARLKDFLEEEIEEIDLLQSSIASA